MRVIIKRFAELARASFLRLQYTRIYFTLKYENLNTLNRNQKSKLVSLLILLFI